MTSVTIDGVAHAVGDGPVALSGGRVLTVSETGEFTYDTGTFHDGPPYVVDAVTFQYTVADAALDTDSAVVTLTIDGRSDPDLGLGVRNVWRGDPDAPDIFVMGDGDKDQVRALDLSDRFDVSDWGVQSFDELRIFDRGSLLTIRDEVSGNLGFAWDRDDRDPAAETLTADNFIFAPVEDLAVTAPQRGNTLHGRAGDDILEASAGFKNMKGGGGADRFVILSDSRAIIRDFEDGADLIDVTDWGVSRFEELSFAEYARHVFVTGGGQTLRIDKQAGVTLGDIDAGDFHGF